MRYDVAFREIMWFLIVFVFHRRAYGSNLGYSHNKPIGYSHHYYLSHLFSFSLTHALHICLFQIRENPYLCANFENQIEKSEIQLINKIFELFTSICLVVWFFGFSFSVSPLRFGCTCCISSKVDAHYIQSQHTNTMSAFMSTSLWAYCLSFHRLFQLLTHFLAHFFFI